MEMLIKENNRIQMFAENEPNNYITYYLYDKKLHKIVNHITYNQRQDHIERSKKLFNSYDEKVINRMYTKLLHIYINMAEEISFTCLRQIQNIVLDCVVYGSDDLLIMTISNKILLKAHSRTTRKNIKNSTYGEFHNESY